MNVPELMGALMELALEHPDGPATAGAFDRAFVFDLTDGEPFVLRIEGGRITVEPGASDVDWRIGDWQRATCVRTSTKVLLEGIRGERTLAEAFFAGELGFSASRAAARHSDATTEGSIAPWLYALFRLAHEQAAERGYHELMSGVERGAGSHT